MSVHLAALLIFVLASFVLVGGLVAWEIDRHTFTMSRYDFVQAHIDQQRIVERLPHVDFVKVNITVDTSGFREAMRRLGAASDAASSAFGQLGHAIEAAMTEHDRRRVREHNKLIGYDPDEWAARHLFGTDLYWDDVE